MALIKCPECGQDVSSAAASCPKCGHPIAAQPPPIPTSAAAPPAPVKQKSKHVGCGWVLAIFLGIPFVLVMCSVNSGREERAQFEALRQQQEQQRAQVEAARVAALSPEEREADQKKKEAALMAQMRAAARRDGMLWNYSTRADEMGRGKIETADVKSMNTTDLPFPYSGAQHAWLQLRKHPQHGRDVIFSIDRGQIQCGIRGCQVNVRFGEGKPIRFDAAEPSDHSSDTIFIQGYDRFVSNLRKADTTTIEVEFFQAGIRTFKFDTSGLEWK